MGAKTNSSERLRKVAGVVNVDAPMAKSTMLVTTSILTNPLLAMVVKCSKSGTKTVDGLALRSHAVRKPAEAKNAELPQTDSLKRLRKVVGVVNANAPMAKYTMLVTTSILTNP